MKYDAKAMQSEDKHAEFIEWLAKETASGLRGAKGNSEQIKSCVFLFLHRAYEAHLDPDEVVDLLGVKEPNIIDMAELYGADEDAVLSFYELLDPIISQIYE